MVCLQTQADGPGWDGSPLWGLEQYNPASGRFAKALRDLDKFPKKMT